MCTFVPKVGMKMCEMYKKVGMKMCYDFDISLQHDGKICVMSTILE